MGSFATLTRISPGPPKNALQRVRERLAARLFSCPERKKGQRRRTVSHCDLNQELANAASSWFHSHTGAELAEIYQRILRANAIWCMRLGLGFKFPNRRMKPLDQAI